MQLDSGVRWRIVFVVARGENMYVRCVLDAMKMVLRGEVEEYCTASLPR